MLSFPLLIKIILHKLTKSNPEDLIMAKLSVKDVPVQGKRVLVRVDFNVPLDENQVITVISITDDETP